jgi:hypothetical protein
VIRLKALIFLFIGLLSFSAFAQEDLQREFQPFLDSGVLGTLDGIDSWGQNSVDNLFTLDFTVQEKLHELGYATMEQASRDPVAMSTLRQTAKNFLNSLNEGSDSERDIDRVFRDSPVFHNFFLSSSGL